MKLFRKETTCDGRKIVYIGKFKICSYKPKPSLKLFKEMGVKIGERTSFIAPPHFGSEPFLIEIGSDCVISFEVTFLTHDGSRKICSKFIEGYDKKYILNWQKIKVGNNVFVGCRSIIMPGVTIGDDVVIGAGSVVTKDIPSGEVWAGNPAKFIKKTPELAQRFVELSNSEKVESIKKEFYNELVKRGLIKQV